jgi:hypothetical protein
MLAALALTVVMVSRQAPVPVSWRSVVSTVAALVAMAAAVLALSWMEPSLAALAAGVAAGSLTYGVAALALDVAGARRALAARLRPERKPP